MNPDDEGEDVLVINDHELVSGRERMRFGEGWSRTVRLPSIESVIVDAEGTRRNAALTISSADLTGVTLVVEASRFDSGCAPPGPQPSR